MSDDIRRKLSAELQKLDMPEAAQDALEGLYSDVDSPLAEPKRTLTETLWTAAEMSRHKPERKAAIKVLRQRVMNGEFDD
jgi:hypothetical protein